VVRLPFPGGKRFAFAIMDDTDVATVHNVTPVYELLERVDLRATKTVWPVGCPEGSRDFSISQTLENDEYRQFVMALRQRGFEITWHGATMESSRRERTVAALDRFAEIFGGYPHIHANHAENRENLYWGAERIDDPVLKGLLRRLSSQAGDYYLGHVPGSPYWWGDLCAKHITYARNLTFNGLNLAAINPSMPYRDPARPLAAWWFSAANADDVGEFRELLASKNQQRLEDEGGFAIVATHFGKGFVRGGRLDPDVRARLEELAARPGWFPSVGELLGWLRARRHEDVLPPGEWRGMQWRWARDLVTRRWRQRRRQKRRRAAFRRHPEMRQEGQPS
jgi:hypothetical protein